MDGLVAATLDGGFEVELTWASQARGSAGLAALPSIGSSATAASDATLGRLRVSLGGHTVWHGKAQSAGFEWTWVELLEFLGDSWVFLALEDGAPFGIAPSTVPRMVAAAETVIERSNPLGSDVQEEHLEAYRATHDLAEAVQGAVLPPVWVVRDGTQGWVASTRLTAAAPIDEVLAVLEQTGDAIAARLEGLDDERSTEAVRRWRGRAAQPRLRMIEAATSYEPGLVAEVQDLFLSNEERDWDSLASDELLAAARLVGPQPATTLEPILDALRQLGKTGSDALERASAAAVEVLDSVIDDRPYAQGYELAAWLRTQPGIVDSRGRVEPSRLLDSWNVPCVTTGLRLKEVDAIGCWGPRHGPAVLVNSDAQWAGAARRRRATLAHEICHLLVDRSGSLPLAEVLGGRTPAHVEQRARAFAAELLLPRQLAWQGFARHAGTETDPVKSMCARFGVSRELCVWQIRNSDSFRSLAPSDPLTLQLAAVNDHGFVAR